MKDKIRCSNWAICLKIITHIITKVANDEYDIIIVDVVMNIVLSWEVISSIHCILLGDKSVVPKPFRAPPPGTKPIRPAIKHHG